MPSFRSAACLWPAALLIVVASLALPAHGEDAWPEAWSFWAVNDPQSSHIVDHSSWQAFLDDHLKPHADGIHRLAYQAAAATDAERLQTYLNALAAIDPRTLNRDEQFAYWVNLYNALTVQLVMAHPEEKGIKQMGGSFLPFGPWDDELIQIAGQPVTLNDIEHRILRPIWRDPRIHYAVNCASLSCPRLSLQAFTAANIESLLDAGERYYINHPRGVEIINHKHLRLSSIYQWYQRDFGDSERDLLAYLGRFHPHLAESTDDVKMRIDYVYDWSLNSVRPR